MARITSHTHKQTLPTATWEIDHGLSCRPVVTVMVDEGGVLTGILPDSISFPSLSHVTITFTSARTGEARLA